VVASEAREGTGDGGATAQTWWGSAGAVWQGREGVQKQWAGMGGERLCLASGVWCFDAALGDGRGWLC
jgi:hypothetical protein